MKPTRLTVTICRKLTMSLFIIAIVAIVAGAFWTSVLLHAWVIRGLAFNWYAPMLIVAGILVGLVGNVCDQHWFKNQHIK